MMIFKLGDNVLFMTRYTASTCIYKMAFHITQKLNAKFPESSHIN